MVTPGAGSSKRSKSVFRYAATAIGLSTGSARIFVIKIFVMTEKICSSCKKLKPLEAFYKESRVKDGHMRRCKICHGLATAKYRTQNPEVYRKASLKYWNKCSEAKRHTAWLKRYGLSKEEYEIMFKKQNGLCLICKKQCSSGQNLSVDHCHRTGKVRGLLCKKCNTALGMLEDNIQYFETAILYLKNYEESL
jgi:hypothetical protein